MDRREALRRIAKYPRGLVRVDNARQVAEALGVHLETLLIIEPDLVRRPATRWARLPGRRGDARTIELVQLSDLGATICRYMGLYADRDHALASPHGTPGKQADYVGWRAAIRIAREWWGPDGVFELHQDVPAIPDVLWREPVYKV